MINDADSLSRSASQHDHSDQSSVYLRNQSSCSSLTSGIGQSDQSIGNDRNTYTSISDQDAELHPNDEHPIDRPSRSSKISSSCQQSSPFPTVTEKGATTSASNKPANGSHQDESLKLNIKRFVDIVFTDSQSISLEKKAEFGQLMRSSEARLLFAMFVDDYRVNSKRVNELTFYSLAQYFSIVLLECLLAEDFRPAKIIMNMMFTYYYEQNYDKIPPRDRPTEVEDQTNNEISSQPKTIKTYLYTLLKDQEIFKSIRFWTSAFYESVIIERNNHSVFVDRGPGKLSNERRNEELDCSKNITFGLLGSFIHNMCLLNLSHEFCQEFLDKHSTIAGLSDEQLEMLRSNLKAMFNDEIAGQATMSQTTASERLSTFLHKLSAKLNQSSSQAQQLR